jgi:SAM-dependent methyltransferase
MSKALGDAVVADFGREWTTFDQSNLPDDEAADRFDEYFWMFRFDPEAEGFDLGAGSGRWARLVAPRVKLLHVIEPSDAIEAARLNITAPNVRFHRQTAATFDLRDQDFGYCLGVLHHIPDPEAALRRAVAALKPGAQFLVYIYYALDGRPWWFRALWRVADLGRRVVSRLPFAFKRALALVIATVVYWPLARMGRPSWPLAYYKDKSFYTMKTDALDRFGTRLEQRFTRAEIEAMMARCGLREIRFSDRPPFWVAIGLKK